MQSELNVSHAAFKWGRVHEKGLYECPPSCGIHNFESGNFLKAPNSQVAMCC